MAPKKIQIKDKNKLRIDWKDGSKTTISLKYLRDECPCANCKGETVLLKTYRPPKIDKTIQGMYDIKNIQVVGGYAIQVTWKDGHDTGIYSWEYLKELGNSEASGTKYDYDKLI